VKVFSNRCGCGSRGFDVARTFLGKSEKLLDFFWDFGRVCVSTMEPTSLLAVGGEEREKRLECLLPARLDARVVGTVS